MTDSLTKAQSELTRLAEIAFDTSRLWTTRYEARKQAAEIATIVTALRGME